RVLLGTRAETGPVHLAPRGQLRLPRSVRAKHPTASAERRSCGRVSFRRHGFVFDHGHGPSCPGPRNPIARVQLCRRRSGALGRTLVWDGREVGGTKPPGGGTRDSSGEPCRNREARANQAAARGQCRLVSRARDRLFKNPLQRGSWAQFARSVETEPFGGSSRLASL